MPDSDDPSLIIDPRLGSLLISASGHLDVSGLTGPPSDATLAFGPPAAEGEAGTLGPYRVVRELGRGGMGAVFLAVDTRLDRKLALKVMLPEFAANAEAKERFLREARAAARISHDNVVTVYEADERDGVPYIAMQLLQGYSLDAFLARKGTPSLRHVVRIGREAALGLAAAHKLGVVHRDVKPANLWLEAPQGRVKLLDFGLVRSAGMDTELTRSGAVIGTPAFMSPEQALGEPVDHRTDLFSLGAVLYWLCSGQFPYPGSSVGAVLRALGTQEPKPVRAQNPKVPEPLAELIHQLLARNPDDRPQSAVAVVHRLHEILEQSADLSAIVPGGASGRAPVSSGTGTSDPWTTRALSGDDQLAGHPTGPAQPKLLHTMQVVAITPSTQPAESQEQDEPPEQEEPQKKPAGPLHTVISSGVVWKEPAEESREEETEEETEEEAEEKTPGRPRRRRAKRRVKRAASKLPIFIGAGGVVLAAAFVAVMLLVAEGRTKTANSAQQKAGDRVGSPGNRQQPEPPPKAPDAGPPATAIPTWEPAPVPPPPTPSSRDKEPTILGSIAADPKFKTVGPEGAVLTGLVARFEKFGDRDIVRAVRPIYRVNGKEVFGRQFGNDLSGSVVMRAKDGYAVGGINGKAGLWCNGFSLTYMRMKPDGDLDPGDSYEGEWGGFNGSGDVIRVFSDGAPVVGVVGKIVGPKTTALGLLFKGQEGWKPAGVLGSDSPTETIIGATNDPTFRDEAPPGGLLVGFDVWYGRFANYDVIDGIRPLYRTAGKESLGQIHGRDTGRGVRVFAKPDYAVGALDVRAGLGLDALTVTFMKIRGEGLDPDDSYQSEKLGGPGGNSHPTLGGDGTPVTGIIGRTNKVKISGLGLAFPAKR